MKGLLEGDDLLVGNGMGIDDGFGVYDVENGGYGLGDFWGPDSARPINQIENENVIIPK